MARYGREMAIYQSPILGIRLQIILRAHVSPIPPVLQKGKGGSTQAGSCTIVLASECLISELLYTQKLCKIFCACWTSNNASVVNKHFLLNNDIIRLTKIMNNLVKDLETISFKVIFQSLKLFDFFFCEEYLIRSPTFINDIFFENIDF